MYNDEPRADEVDELVKQVGVRDAVDRGVDGKEEEEDVGYVAEAIEGWVLVKDTVWRRKVQQRDNRGHLLSPKISPGNRELITFANL